VVFITRGIERRALAATLQALEYVHAEPGTLDQRRYAEFVKLAQAFRPGLSSNSDSSKQAG
jgi:hypothetical protein